MIISKAFTFTGDWGDSVTITIPGSTTKVSHYPGLARFMIDSFNDVLANFNTFITYNENTAEATINQANFIIAVGSTSIKIYFDGDGSLGCNTVNYDSYASDNLVVLVKGNTNAFELLMASGANISSYSTLFGKYSCERLSDGKILTAFRRNNSTGTFWLFEDGTFLQYVSIVKADTLYAFSSYSYSGYALVPAILTNFAYRIVDVYLYCPMLESGSYYTIAGVSVATVQSCLMLTC